MAIDDLLNDSPTAVSQFYECCGSKYYLLLALVDLVVISCILPQMLLFPIQLLFVLYILDFVSTCAFHNETGGIPTFSKKKKSTRRLEFSLTLFYKFQKKKCKFQTRLSEETTEKLLTQTHEMTQVREVTQTPFN